MMSRMKFEAGVSSVLMASRRLPGHGSRVHGKVYAVRAFLRCTGLLLLAGCLSDPPTALGPATGGTGPMVRYEPLAKPDPEVPWPNDLATIVDLTSPTGRRLNTATAVPLEVEANLRRQLNRLDGFSVNGAITVSFDAPLDLATVTAETFRVIDVTPGSKTFGEAMPLDFGEGAFPVTFKPRAVFPFEEDADLPDLVFGRDNEIDGVRVSHWEVETNTLIVRPLFPLRPKTTYAAVITTGMTGTDGEPARSPFDTVNHTGQTRALAALPELVDDEIAFAWAFTTRSVTDDGAAIRDGLDGVGPLGWLKDRYPGKFTSFVDTSVEDDGHGGVYTLDPRALPELLGPLTLAFGGLNTLDFRGVSHLVFGTFEAADLRGDDATIWVRGDVVDHAPSSITFAACIP